MQDRLTLGLTYKLLGTADQKLNGSLKTEGPVSHSILFTLNYRF